jgi:hypothetical protein
MLHARLKREAEMLRILATAVLSLLWGAGAAMAVDCAPNCDFVHDYGPYDFSYIRPGLAGIPVCDRQGNCSPHLVYIYSGHFLPQIRIIVRPTRRAIRVRRPSGD